MTPATFLQFAADRANLLLALFERIEVDEAELLALIARHRTDASPSIEHLRRQLEEFGIIERSASSETVFELSPQMRELFSWLTRRQRLSSATVLLGYLDDLKAGGEELEQAIKADDANVTTLALKEIDGTIERLRALSTANRESIITETQALRSSGSSLSAVLRFQTVRRLWSRFLHPLRQLVEQKGEMDRRIESLRSALDAGEERFTAHGVVQRGFARTIARLARLRRTAFEDHHASILEVAPLYERLRRENRWARSASLALRRIRSEGIQALSLDSRLGIIGWRTRYIMSDVNLRARLSALVGYRPKGPVVIGEAPPLPPPSLISRAELHEALRRSAPIDDILSFILNGWPDRPLGCQIRAYGQIVTGEFGPVEDGEPAAEKIYESRVGQIRAWPLRFPRATS